MQSIWTKYDLEAGYYTPSGSLLKKTLFVMLQPLKWLAPIMVEKPMREKAAHGFSTKQGITKPLRTNAFMQKTLRFLQL